MKRPARGRVGGLLMLSSLVAVIVLWPWFGPAVALPAWFVLFAGGGWLWLSAGTLDVKPIDVPAMRAGDPVKGSGRDAQNVDL